MEPKPIPTEEFEIVAENPMGARYRWKKCPKKVNKPGCACFLDRVGELDLCKSFDSDKPACRFRGGR